MTCPKCGSTSCGIRSNYERDERGQFKMSTGVCLDCKHEWPYTEPPIYPAENWQARTESAEAKGKSLRRMLEEESKQRFALGERCMVATDNAIRAEAELERVRGEIAHLDIDKAEEIGARLRDQRDEARTREDEAVAKLAAGRDKIGRWHQESLEAHADPRVTRALEDVLLLLDCSKCIDAPGFVRVKVEGDNIRIGKSDARKVDGWLDEDGTLLLVKP